MIHFITSNRKRAELELLLGGLPLSFTRLTLPRPSAALLAERAQERAASAFAELGQGCIAEVTELRTAAGGFSGADYKKALEREGDEFHARIAGPAVAAVAVAYVDGEQTLVFEGALHGELLAEPRGSGGIGWDGTFQPEDTTQTLAEMRHHKSFTNMRLRPFLELADALRGRSFGGVFEAHITVALVGEEELVRFDALCSDLAVKSIHIVLPRGEIRFQPMTSSYHHGELLAVQGEVFELARRIAGAGFEVTRAKIEATGSNREIPQSDADAESFPHNYFEFHVKTRIAPSADAGKLAEAVSLHGAHLSRNARKVFADGTRQHFVTLRVYEAGRRRAEERFATLRDAIQQAGFEWREPIREYTVYDSNVSVDKGWLPT
ncbi:MAG: non-canonical purine NTP pyrophosphatase [Polyangiales bacterium]